MNALQAARATAEWRTLAALSPHFEIYSWYIITRHLAVWQWRQEEENVTWYLTYGVRVVTDDASKWCLTKLDELTGGKDTAILVPQPVPVATRLTAWEIVAEIVIFRQDFA